MLIDTHCHLNFHSFKKDIAEVVARAKKAGVAKIIIPGAKLDSSKRAVTIAQRFPSCFAAIGIHPHHAQSISSPPVEIMSELESLAQSKKVVAIGEIGLDYHKYVNYPPISEIDKSLQRELFLVQLNLAQELGLPLIIHCRNAHDDLLDILKVYLNSTQKPLPGVFHCFDGEKKHLKQVIHLGFLVGFDGNITYPENGHLRDLVKTTPPNHLVLETDSPFLTPVPYRGTRNEPSYIHLVAKAFSTAHNKTTEEIVEITYQNSLKLFRI